MDWILLICYVKRWIAYAYFIFWERQMFLPMFWQNMDVLVRTLFGLFFHFAYFVSGVLFSSIIFWFLKEKPTTKLLGVNATRHLKPTTTTTWASGSRTCDGARSITLIGPDTLLTFSPLSRIWAHFTSDPYQKTSMRMFGPCPFCLCVLRRRC